MILVLPGFISMKVYGLFSPQDNLPLKDSLLEAIAFSILNGAAMWWAIDLLLKEEQTLIRFALIVLVFLVAPVIWPILLDRIVNFLEKQRWILTRRMNAWDDFFMRREESWVIVHLKDGRRIGGYFGSNSYASLFPNSGHLYIEETWNIDLATNAFVAPVPDSAGLILRPEDYHFVEVKQT